jgi:hypothetical protein
MGRGQAIEAAVRYQSTWCSESWEEVKFQKNGLVSRRAKQ